MNVFCDASKDMDDDKGGIAIILPAWVPGGASREQIEIAYPVTPLYSCELGELLAVSEALHIATKEIQQSSNNPLLSGRPVIVRIFNDNRDNLWYLQGEGWLHPGLIALADPVLKAIAAQSRLINTFGVDVKLELVWIPGHHHDIRPHKTADHLAYLARRLDRSYTNTLNWTQREEGAVMRLLKPYLADAALRAAQHMPELRSRLPAALVSAPKSGSAPPTTAEHSNPAVPRAKTHLGQRLRTSAIGPLRRATPVSLNFCNNLNPAPHLSQTRWRSSPTTTTTPRLQTSVGSHNSFNISGDSTKHIPSYNPPNVGSD
ncbi:hypothetical protein NEMBOFW57_010913 [Staphylotrichum longicolle]|uniref:Uncharacterized protein n=1 Tax=Staphylotrichum longicolle TaxID=669026 RepID=A0AAD4HUL3_9PEZI|nr:hypothetical protein NEMBOFW57_010913 [Staphylotrichum longicolle]